MQKKGQVSIGETLAFSLSDRRVLYNLLEYTLSKSTCQEDFKEVKFYITDVDSSVQTLQHHGRLRPMKSNLFQPQLFDNENRTFGITDDVGANTSQE